MSKLLKYTFFSLFTAFLAGCSHPVWMYKVDVQQGNLIREQDVKQVKKGMSMSEVKTIMGEPVLVDTFNNQRWSYVYTLQIKGGEAQKRKMTIIFKNDAVSKILDGGLLSGRPAKAGKSQHGHRHAKPAKSQLFG